jgi:hypothetical protein
VPEFCVVVIEREQVVTGGNGVELVANVEVGTKRALHGSLTTSDEKTERNGDIVDNILESVIVFNGRGKGWPMTEQLADRFMIGDVDVLDLELVEVGTDVCGLFARKGTAESVG